MQMPLSESWCTPEAPEATTSPQDLFQVAVRPGGLRDLLVLTGQVDLDAAAQLRGQAVELAARARPVEIDWSGAEHVGPSAVQVLLALAAAMTAGGHTLEVRSDNPRVRGFLELAGLASHFPMAEEKGETS